MAPWKCPECGVWWAGLEHRCAPVVTSTDVPKWPAYPLPYDTVTTTVRCTCPPNRGDNYYGTCPIHDVHVSFTGWR
jgi:hypothetical protein